MGTIQEPLRAIPAGIDYLLTPTRPSRILQPGDESGRQRNRLRGELDGWVTDALKEGMAKVHSEGGIVNLVGTRKTLLREICDLLSF